MSKKLVVRAWYSVGTDINDPLEQRWLLSMNMEPLAIGVSFLIEPSADEVEVAWDMMYESIKQGLRERLGQE